MRLHLSKRRHSQVVRQRSAKPLFPGSNPGDASRKAHLQTCKCAFFLCQKRGIVYILPILYIIQNDRITIPQPHRYAWRDVPEVRFTNPCTKGPFSIYASLRKKRWHSVVLSNLFSLSPGKGERPSLTKRKSLPCVKGGGLCVAKLGGIVYTCCRFEENTK